MAHSMCSDKPSDEVIANGRGRAPIACQQCSKAKAGCDKKLPCGRCRASIIWSDAPPSTAGIASSNVSKCFQRKLWRCTISNRKGASWVSRLWQQSWPGIIKIAYVWTFTLRNHNSRTCSSRHSYEKLAVDSLYERASGPSAAGICQGLHCLVVSQALTALRGLLLMDHREAHLFAIGILACERELALGNLVTGNEPERARQNLFQAVAAWSGCGWLMSTAVLQSRIRSSCGQLSRDENQDKADGHVCRNGFHMTVLFDEPPVQSVSQILVPEAIKKTICAGEALNVVRSWFEEAHHELPDIGKESTLKDVSQSSLSSALEEIHRRSYYVLKAVDVTCARGNTCTDYGCQRSQSLSRVHHVLGRWHDSFRGVMATSPLRIEGQEMLVLYSLIWLATLVDVTRLERRMLQQIERGTEGTESTDSVQSKRDLALKQVHCGQIFRIIQSLVRYAPRWWPLAIYRATLILWTASLTPCQVDKSATIDPSLILSSDFGPIAWGDTVAINAYPLDHERTQALIGLEDDLIPVLISEDGTEIFMSHPEHILEYGIAFVKRGPPSLLRDGVLARLEALQESCYRVEEMAKESTPRSMS
ncbi:hypothetical protein NLU13_4496 [Sarocladium strictum]|uniref:Zn(2)-C6 fungal-type domain-containing protein n=1 Tax=Sarocladium strictum TaxID=5046 RepID=A0AA39GJB4_SARSR|nr:hypothetical protein NLU13_4496 [Sarocladium strictum]